MVKSCCPEWGLKGYDFARVKQHFQYVFGCVFMRELFFVLAHKTVGIVSTDTAKITLRLKTTMAYLQQVSIHKHSLI